MMNASTIGAPAFSAGQDAADVLVHALPSLKRAEAVERQRLRDHLREVDTSILQLDLRCAIARRKLDAAEQRYSGRRTRLETLESELADHPPSFAWIRGAIYILMALLILLADFAFLTQVLGAVFELPMQLAVPNTDPQEYVGPVGALAPRYWEFGIPYFAEIYATTLGVLLLAMSFKAWGDRKPSAPLPPTATPYQRVVRVLARIPQFSVMFLTVTALLAISYARVAVEYGSFGEQDTAVDPDPAVLVARAVAAIVGLACPVVGVFLFTRGVDAVTKRVSLITLLSRTRSLERVRNYREDVWRKEFEALEAKRRERADLISPEAWEERKAALVDQFRLGYAAGVRAELDIGGKAGVYRRLRARLLIPSVTVQ